MSSSRSKRFLLAVVVAGIVGVLLALALSAPAANSIDVTDARMTFVGLWQGNDPVFGNLSVPTGAGFSYTPGVYSVGTGANHLNLMHLKTYTITSSSSATLVLSDGTLLQPDGSAAGFTKIREVWIGLPSTNTASAIVVGNAASHAWAAAGLPLVTTASQFTVTKGGGPFRASQNSAAGYAVSSGTLDQVKITNSDGANSALVLVMIAGE